MPEPLALPEGYTQRPLTVEDAAAVTAVTAAEELAALGEVAIEEADVLTDWGRPSYDLGAHSVGVLASDGRLVAYAETPGGFRADAAVHPDHHGRGLGTALAAWVVTRGREIGQPIIGMPNPQGSPGDRLLEALGWFVRWTSWGLELPAGVEVPRRSLPPAYTLREATPEDYAEAWTVVEDAFLEWSRREREPLADWISAIVDRPGSEPWNLRLAIAPDGSVAAVCHIHLSMQGREGYVEKLATRADRRNLGLAQALLVDAFAAARAHGARKSTLSTDSRTGALGLYERVGMVIASTWVHRGTETGA